MKHHDDQRTYKDPVCGMELSYVTATDIVEYKGKTYLFCAPTCRERFEKTPDDFLRPHRQHGLRSSKV